MMKITAEEARKLSGPTIAERVDEVFELIRREAKPKVRELRLHDDFWTNEGYRRTKDWMEAAEMLAKEGFTVEFFYEERQFVNMYTIVKW
jgi:predicted TIM-barrel fold metal-dependent hydrolase